MISSKRYSILRVLVIFHLLYMSHALQCKTCEKNDPACLLALDVQLSNCAGDNEQCYTWFDRTKSHIGVQRGCISPDMPECKTIQEMIEHQTSACIKRASGLDCFTFCSTDGCN